MGTAHLSVLIKPASSLCNLRCGYCFYHDLAESRDIGSYGIMKPETAEALIEKAVEAAQKSISFAFQGGEPSLAGLDIFEYFTACVSEKLAKNQKKLQINYSIQTNGVGITEDFAKFLKAHKFLVGLSLDGVREINDYYRVDATGQGTHGKIIKTAQLFDRLGVDYNILTVVSSQTARHIKKIYNYYKAQGFSYLQFIPCLEPLGAKPFSSRHFLSPALYERFLTDLFLLWHGDFAAGRYISIRFFDNLVRIAAG
ncbi:MAG: radical SAM protein, partial [Oscillospiraceae bacterium]|nr:radical SAM protein [Oscillospiraceae bacterium]